MTLGGSPSRLWSGTAATWLRVLNTPVLLDPIIFQIVLLLPDLELSSLSSGPLRMVCMLLFLS